jgi:ankyrin repeat protein
MKNILLLITFTIISFSENLGSNLFDFLQLDTNQSFILQDSEKIDFILNIKNKNYKKVNSFLLNNNDVDFFIKDKNTPLFYAIDIGDIQVVKLLIEHGANIHNVNSNLKTALHIAVEGNYVDIVRLLLENDIDISCQDIYGQTPMFYAKENANNEIIELLKYFDNNKKEEVSDSIEEFIKNF